MSTIMPVRSLQPESTSPPCCDALLPTRDALVQVLRQIESLLIAISPEQYVQNPVGPVKSAVAPHVRHALDHVNAWLIASRTGTLDYDARQRNTDIERSPAAALARLREQVRDLSSLTPGAPAAAAAADRAWTLLAQVTEGGTPLHFATSPARELAFVLSHTIHHNAILSIMTRQLGITPPEKFGYAPATLTYENHQQNGSTACAR